MCWELFFCHHYQDRCHSVLASITVLPCSDRSSVVHCLLASVCNSCMEGQLYLLTKFFLLSVLNVTAIILWFPSLPIPLFWCCPLLRGSLPSCLLYQRDLHLKKPTVPPLCSMLAYSITNRPWPTCSFSSRPPSYHQVRPGSSSAHVCCSDHVAIGCRSTCTFSQNLLTMFWHQQRMIVWSHCW